MAKAKKKKAAARVLVLDGRLTFPIIGENDRYWLCENTQFRKDNPAVEIRAAEGRKEGD